MAEEKFVPNASVGSSKESAFKKPEPSRRNFLSWLSLGWVAYIGVTGGFFTMIVRFLFPNVLFEPPQTFKIGFPDDFSKRIRDFPIHLFPICNFLFYLQGSARHLQGLL